MRETRHRRTHGLIPLTGGPWRSQIHRDRKWTVRRGQGKGPGSECFMGMEFQYFETQVLEMDGGNGHTVL